jgi:phage baseplate assembly protein W
LFQRLDATLRGEIVQMVKLTLLNSEPRIVVDSVTVTGAALEGTVNIQIGYHVKLTNTRHNYVFPFSLIEATNLDVGG